MTMSLAARESEEVVGDSLIMGIPYHAPLDPVKANGAWSRSFYQVSPYAPLRRSGCGAEC